MTFDKQSNGRRIVIVTTAWDQQISRPTSPTCRQRCQQAAAAAAAAAVAVSEVGQPAACRTARLDGVRRSLCAIAGDMSESGCPRWMSVVRLDGGRRRAACAGTDVAARSRWWNWPTSWPTRSGCWRDSSSNMSATQYNLIDWRRRRRWWWWWYAILTCARKLAVKPA